MWQWDTKPTNKKIDWKFELHTMAPAAAHKHTRIEREKDKLTLRHFTFRLLYKRFYFHPSNFHQFIILSVLYVLTIFYLFDHKAFKLGFLFLRVGMILWIGHSFHSLSLCTMYHRIGNQVAITPRNITHSVFMSYLPSKGTDLCAYVYAYKLFNEINPFKLFFPS